MNFLSEILVLILSSLVAYFVFSEHSSYYQSSLVYSLHLLSGFMILAGLLSAGNLDMDFIRYRGHYWGLSTILGAVGYFLIVVYFIFVVLLFYKGRGGK